MGDYAVLAPEIILLFGAVVALFGGWLPGGKRRTPYWAAAFAAAAALWVPAGEADLFGGMLHYDQGVFFARFAIAGLSAIFLLWLGARGSGADDEPQEAAALALLSSLGGMFLVAARDLIALYMSLELSTMPAYVLIGYARKEARSLEGALKYFLLSLLTSLVMVYGLSFVFGFSGGTAYEAIDLADAGLLGIFVAVFVALGFLAKLSAAPFHYWTPDAYEGARPHMVAFVSTVPKISGLVAMGHLMAALAPTALGVRETLAFAAALSMILGNLAAFPQSDMRRLMAYSGVAHTGYLLMGLAAGTETGAAAAVFYVVAYAIPSLGAMLVFAEDGTDVGELAGLGSRRPWAAWAVTAFFLSLVGIPPAVGFFGKLYLFGASLDTGMVGLVVLAVVMSVASLGYYFRVVRAMFFAEATGEPAGTPHSVPAATAILLCLVATLGLGVLASPLMAYLGLALP